MPYDIACHCGAVGLRVDAELPDQAIQCNCSHCHQKGLALTAVPRGALTITRGEEALQTYRFHREVIAHRFCSTCGAQPFSEGTGADGSAMAMINLRCAPDAKFDSLEMISFDGASA